MDTSELYWLPFKQVCQQLQAANRSSLSGLTELLNLNFGWLLEGLSKFSGPNEHSANAVKSGGAHKAPAWGAKRGIGIDKHLASATAELSQLLTLDALQCHLLLKRWLKDNDVSIPPPAAAPAAAATAAAAPLALPAPAAGTVATPAAAAAAAKPSSSPGQAVLPLDVVQGVADYYAEERIYLAKCQQFIVMTAMDVAADASQPCRDLLKRLLEAGWEAKAADSLAALLKPRSTAAAAAAAGGGGGSAGSSAGAAAGALVAVQPAAELCHVVKPADLEQRLHLHQLHERCELLCLLTQLYCGPDPATSPACHALATLAASAAAAAGEAAAGDAAAEDAAQAKSLLQELQAMRWPECSEERLLQLLQQLGEAVFVAGAGGGAGMLAGTLAGNSAAGGQQQQQQRGGWAAGDSQAANMQQLGEALACALLLAALKPGQLLQRLAGAAASVQQSGGALPRGVCAFRQWRSVEAALMGWRQHVPGSVLALLSVYAYNQLLASYRGAADAISESIQQMALQAGGFAAIAAPLQQEELAPGTLAGGLFRGLLLQGLCLMAAAFDLSPWRLPGQVLSQLLELWAAVVADSPQLAQQVWDESLDATRPLRHFLDEAAAMFPAVPGPFLTLTTGLCQGREAGNAAYSYICNKPSLAVAYEASSAGVLLQGDEALLMQELPWPKAPEVQGSNLPQGIRGKVYPLPEFVKSAAAAAASDGGAPQAAAADQGSFLVTWDVQAEEGIGPVLLLARAAHCLQQLHAVNVARQAVAGSEHWQDLRLILKLLAALLKSEPLLAKPLMKVRIDYAGSQKMDWLDVIIASLNVLPALATTVSAATAGNGGKSSQLAGIGGKGSQFEFGQQVLEALADCLLAASAAAGCQPGRVLAALGSCQLFAGSLNLNCNEPLPLVPLEALAGWVQRQQQLAAEAVEDWRALEALQALQDNLEVPAKSYPLTAAVLSLTSSLLDQQCTWGLVPGLVSFVLHRVLGAMPWLPFSCAAARMSLAASALGVVRGALVAGAVAQPGAAGPKAAGAPGGVLVTVLAAKVVHDLATAGHGYLSAALPPPADALRDMAEQQAGSSALLAAGSELAEGLLLLVPVLLGALCHLSPEMPLQQYWGADPPGGGLSPAAIIASYATYPYATHLPLLAVEALNAFAILQAGPSTAAGPSGFGYSSTPQPGGGGPAVPGSGGTPAGLGALAGPVQAGLNPAQPYLRGMHSAAATGLGLGGRGGAGGWWRPSGLFAALLAAVPDLRGALLRPFEPQVAQQYPEWAMRCMTLLEAGARSHSEILDTLCFPSSLKLPTDSAAAAADAPASKSSKGASAKDAEPPFSALDGMWQLLRQAPALLASQPALLAALLRLLATLWECQGAAHGAVELLRAQPDFWKAFKACLPTSASLPSASAEQQDAAECEAAAWRLQVHACALHILLLELLSVQANSGSSNADQQQQQQQSKGYAELLSSVGVLELSKLLGGASQLGLQQPLMDQLARMLQVTYLQLGASAITGAWGPPSLTADALSVAAQLRTEVQPLLAAAAVGEYSLADLRAACGILADPDAPRGIAAADEDDEEMDTDVGADGSGVRGSVLVDALYGRPFGEVLLGYSAVTPWSWGAGETQYGRQFLFDSSRLMRLLGPFTIDECEGALALAVTLDDVSGAAALAHARLALLQAATSLFASMSRYAPARQELMSTATARELLSSSLQAVDKALQETCHLSSGPAARLLAVPWGLPFIGHASSTALLLAARSMLLSVRVWKVAAASEAAAAAAAGGGRPVGRPVLMARALNQQQQQLIGAAAGAGGVKALPAAAGAFGGSSSSSQSGDAAALAACAKCAGLLSRWLRGRGGDSLTEAAAAAGAVSGAVAADVEVVECLSTSLLLMLQALPGQTLKAAAAARKGSSSSSPAAAKQQSAAAAGEGMTPAELLELEAALLDLLPVLCKACAMAVDQQQQQGEQGPAGGAAAAAGAGGVSASRQAYAAAMLQLLIEILQHQLPPATWLSAVSQQLALVPMLAAAAARAGNSGFVTTAAALDAAAPPVGRIAAAQPNGVDPSSSRAAAGSSSSSATAAAAAAAERGAAAATAAAAAGAAVTDISVLELALSVAQAPEGSLQLWQQGLLPVLVAYCRQIMHTQQATGLLDVASLGFVGPGSGVYGSAAGFGGYDLSPLMEVSLSTLGAYMSLSGSSSGGSSSSSVQTVRGLPAAPGGLPAGSAAAAAAASAGAGCIWSPRHQQWCLLLGLLSTLLQQLSRSTAVEDIAMQLLVAAEPRLLLAVQLQSCGRSSSSSSNQGAGFNSSGQGALPSQPHGVLTLAWGPESGFGGGSGLGSGAGGLGYSREAPLPLTLANLLEAERAMYLLGFMVPHIGVWQLQRPGSLAAFRAAAARLVEFVAAPSQDRSLRVRCAPLSPFERRLAKLPSGLEASDGWFKLCSAGGANNLAASSAAAAAAAAPATPSAAAASPTAGAGSKPSSPAGGLITAGPFSAAGGGGGGASPRAAAAAAAAAADAAGGLMGGGGIGGCSEYCARLCEAVYTACEHSLAFLLATAPVVEPGEIAAAAAAGGAWQGTWPAAKALAALQDQVLAVGMSMVQHPQSISPRRRRVAAACVRIAAAAGQLHEAVAAPRWGGTSRRGAGLDAVAAEAVRRHERMASIARAAASGIRNNHAHQPLFRESLTAVGVAAAGLLSRLQFVEKGYIRVPYAQECSLGSQSDFKLQRHR
uniref:Uncharacterized protein n=1 Tax=Tetradesmus obliquus TaxID=3088 RepID=A0A383VTA8_TETOB